MLDVDIEVGWSRAFLSGCLLPGCVSDTHVHCLASNKGEGSSWKNPACNFKIMVSCIWCVCVLISGILARLSAGANYVFVMSNYGRLKD